MSSFKSKTWQHVRHGLIVSAVIAATACTPIIRNHGYVPSEAELSVLQIGVDTRETVVASVGPPTSGGVLEGSALYYVSSQFRHLGAFAPEEIDRQVLAISFAANGTVSNIERFALQDGQVVALSRRVTDDGIRDTTFISQLLGSLGRVDAGTFLGES
jgi:outer membrane protein assembly factor BamE (lipoprotein component of BamABCDE complex)